MVEAAQIKIAIADTDSGRPTDVRNRMFDPLLTTKAVGKGIGLGLAIARQMIEKTSGQHRRLY